MNIRASAIAAMLLVPCFAFSQDQAASPTDEAQAMTPERCASAVETFDMLWCSRTLLAASVGGFHTELSSLMKAGLPREQAGALYSNYMNAEKLANEICAKWFSGGPLTEIFRNDCIVGQLDALAGSARAYVCTLRIGESCEELPTKETK